VEDLHGNALHHDFPFFNLDVKFRFHDVIELMYMSLGKLRVAIPTKGQGGLEDVVSEVFGRANTFTIVNVEDNSIKNVEVLQNPAASYEHGAGPIVVKMLIDSGVNVVIAAEFGPGVSTLLNQHNVTKITVQAGTLVTESIKDALPRLPRVKEEPLRK